MVLMEGPVTRKVRYGSGFLCPAARFAVGRGDEKRGGVIA
jgi:hypothetical protein